MRRVGERDPAAYYFFVVIRSRPDILARAQECLAVNSHIEVIADRRLGQRRAESAPCAVERRVSDRRRTTKPPLDDRTHPTVFVRKYVPTYAELQQQVDALTRRVQDARAEKEQLQQEIMHLTANLHALTAAEAIRRTSGALAAVADRLARWGH
jgi:phage shock protein A